MIAVHPNREELAQQFERAADRYRAYAREVASPSRRDLAYVIVQLMLGRAAALRGTDPVQIPGPEGAPSIMSHADGRLEWCAGE